MTKLFHGALGAILLLAMTAGPVMAEAGVFSDGALTVGGRFGEGGYSQGSLDILAPVFRTGNGLVFVNPRGTIGDGSRQEVNLGLGYRHLFPDSKMILGGNVYYDSAWSLNDNQFDQLGMGVEMLTQWVDARFNYYLPEDTTMATDGKPATWTDPYAQNHGIFQEYYSYVERAREGWDAEIGARLPYIDRFADTRIFVGYHDFDAIVKSIF